MKCLLTMHSEPSSISEAPKTTAFEYSGELNLNVVRGSSVPVIRWDNSAEIETFTKTNGETRDTTPGRGIHLLETMTKTDTIREGTDSDPRDALHMLGTFTHTDANREPTDADK